MCVFHRRGEGEVFKLFKKILGIGNNDRENIELIRKSKYFDEKYYRLENPNLKGDPCRHYYYYGWKEGKSPSFEFSNNFYLKNYKDVEDAGINPLFHYLKFGKAENRLIESDNGLTLKKIYEKVYNCPYFYKTYINDSDIKRVNIFFDCIDSAVYDMKELFKYVVKFCDKYDYKLRIVYYMADFELLKDFLSINEIKLPSNTVFLNLKSSNYLEVGLNEKYICTSWKNARALLNTCNINTNIYFYLDSLDGVEKEEYYQISNICTNDNICCLVNDVDVLKDIRKCNLKFEVNDVKASFGDANQLYCDFDRMFIVGVEILNDAFLNGVLASNDWKVNIIENVRDFKFHFDTNVSIRKVDEIEDDAALIFVMSYDKKDIDTFGPTIISWVEEEKFVKKKYIDILKKDSINELEGEEIFHFAKIENQSEEFISCVRKLEGDLDV